MIRHVGVVIPAADEEEHTASCLFALRRAILRLHQEHAAPRRPLSVDVVVVLDACTDRTAKIVAQFPEARTVVSDARCVGIARRVGTQAVLAATTAPVDHIWTAHSDADSEVPSNWLTSMVRAADEGHDVVLGTVTPAGELPAAERRTWLAQHDQSDGHPHVHGANLGIRAGCLQRLGGWRALHTGEDVDLAKRAQAYGASILRTAAIPVRTSARRYGRVPEGFSSYLRNLSPSYG